MDKLVQLFTEDAVLEMPPFDGWYQGPADIVTLSKNHCPAEGPGDMRFTAITANGQPAAALYMINHETGRHEEFQMHVLEVRPAVSRTWWRFTPTGCSRSSGCPPRCSRSAKSTFVQRLLALSLQKSTFAAGRVETPSSQQ